MSLYPKRFDIKSLEEELNKLNIVDNNVAVRKSLETILQHLNDTSGNSEKTLPAITKCLSSLDMLSKKMAMWFVSTYKGEPDLLLMAVNSLMKDCSNPNPVLRCLAMKTLTQIPHENFAEFSFQAVAKGLNDNNAYVRRAAVISCLKLHKLNPTLIEEREITDILYSMIRDKDPIVVLNCLQTLDEILKSEGGIVVNKNIAFYLMNHLDMFPEWGISVLINFLQRYEAQTEEEMYDLMNLMDRFLQKGSSSAAVNTVDMLLTLTKGSKTLQTSVLSRAKNPLLHFLNRGNPELTSVMIDYIEEIYLPDFLHELEKSYSLFLCKQKEPVFVKSKRIKLLCKIVNENSIQDILDELVLYSSSPELCKTAVSAIGEISMKSEEFHDLCVKKLIQMLEVGTEKVKGEVFVIVSKMNANSLDSNSLHALLEQVTHGLNVTHIKENAEILSALFWLIGEYGERFESMPYLIENFIEEFSHWHHTKLCNALIIAGVKLLVKKPAEFQPVIGLLFENCFKKCGIAVRETLLYYYQLLGHEPVICVQDVMCNKQI